MKAPVTVALAALTLVSVDAGGIYWTDRASGVRGIRRCGFDGSAPVAIPGLQARTDPRGIVVDRSNGTIHFADNTTIYSVQYDFTTNSAGAVSTLVATTGTPRDLWHDRRDHWLYYANQAAGTVHRVALPGALDDGAAAFYPKSVPDAYFLGLYRYTNGSGGIDLGMVSGNSANNLWVIGTMNSDTLTAAVLATRAAGSNLRGVQVDPDGRFVYWCEKDTRSIYRAPFSALDPSHLGTPVQTVYSGLNAPHGLRLDLPRRRLYWVDSGTNSGGGFGQGGVNRGDLDGSGAPESLVAMNAGSVQPWDLDLDTQPATFAEWQALWFRNDATAAVKSAAADPDADGLDNTLEFALGTDPLRSTPTPVTAGLWLDPPPTTPGGGPSPQSTVTRLPGIPGLTYLVQLTDDLITWRSNETKLAVTIEVGTAVPGDEGIETVTVRSLTQISPGTRQWLRVKVTML